MPKNFFELVEDWKEHFKIDCFIASLFSMLLDSPVVSFETRHRRFTHSSLHKDVSYYDNYVRAISKSCLLGKSIHLTGCKIKWIFAYLVKKYRGTILYDVMKTFPLKVL